MTNPFAQKRPWRAFVLAVFGCVLFFTVPLVAADDREKDEIIALLGTETKPAEPLLPEGVSVETDYFPGEGSPIGSVQLREGDPLVIHRGASVAYPLKKDVSVFAGDTIITES